VEGESAPRSIALPCVVALSPWQTVQTCRVWRSVLGIRLPVLEPQQCTKMDLLAPAGVGEGGPVMFTSPTPPAFTQEIYKGVENRQ